MIRPDARVEAEPVVADGHVQQLGQGAGHLHPGGAAADHHEGQGARRRPPSGSASASSRRRRTWSRRRPGVGQGVEREGELGGTRDAEEPGGGPAGHDRPSRRAAGRPSSSGAPAGGPSRRRSPWPNRKVTLSAPPEDGPDRVGHVARLEAGRGHLVEQRLEGVEVALVDDGHLDRLRRPGPGPPTGRRTRPRRSPRGASRPWWHSRQVAGRPVGRAAPRESCTPRRYRWRTGPSSGPLAHRRRAGRAPSVARGGFDMITGLIVGLVAGAALGVVVGPAGPRRAGDRGPDGRGPPRRRRRRNRP